MLDSRLCAHYKFSSTYYYYLVNNCVPVTTVAGRQHLQSADNTDVSFLAHVTAQSPSCGGVCQQTNDLCTIPVRLETTKVNAVRASKMCMHIR